MISESHLRKLSYRTFCPIIPLREFQAQTPCSLPPPLRSSCSNWQADVRCLPPLQGVALIALLSFRSNLILSDVVLVAVRPREPSLKGSVFLPTTLHGCSKISYGLVSEKSSLLDLTCTTSLWLSLEEQVPPIRYSLELLQALHE